MKFKERCLIRIQNHFISIDFAYDNFCTTLFNYKELFNKREQNKLINKIEELEKKLKKLKKEVKNTYFIKEEEINVRNDND